MFLKAGTLKCARLEFSGCRVNPLRPLGHFLSVLFFFKKKFTVFLFVGFFFFLKNVFNIFSSWTGLGGGGGKVTTPPKPKPHPLKPMSAAACPPSSFWVVLRTSLSPCVRCSFFFKVWCFSSSVVLLSHPSSFGVLPLSFLPFAYSFCVPHSICRGRHSVFDVARSVLPEESDWYFCWVGSICRGRRARVCVVVHGCFKNCWWLHDGQHVIDSMLHQQTPTWGWSQPTPQSICTFAGIESREQTPNIFGARCSERCDSDLVWTQHDPRVWSRYRWLTLALLQLSSFTVESRWRKCPGHLAISQIKPSWSRQPQKQIVFDMEAQISVNIDTASNRHSTLAALSGWWWCQSESEKEMVKFLTASFLNRTVRHRQYVETVIEHVVCFARIDLALVSPTSSTCRLSGSVTEIVVDVEQCKKLWQRSGGTDDRCVQVECCLMCFDTFIGHGYLSVHGKVRRTKGCFLMVVGELWRLPEPSAMCWQVVVAMFCMFIERDQIHVLCAASVEDSGRRVIPKWLQTTRTQDLGQALGLEQHQCVPLFRSSVWVHRRATCLVGKSWERRDKVNHGERWQQSRLWDRTSSKRQFHGLAVAYVDDWMIAVDEDSADGLPALAGERALHECGPWEHGTFTMQSRQQGRGRGALCRVQHVQNRWCFWICHQHEENNLASPQMRGSLLLEYVGVAWFYDVGCKQTRSPCFGVSSDTAAKTFLQKLWGGWLVYCKLGVSSWRIITKWAFDWNHKHHIPGASGTHSFCGQLAQWKVGSSGKKLACSGAASCCRCTTENSPTSVSHSGKSAEVGTKSCQKVAALVPATVVLDARRVCGKLAHSDSSCRRLKNHRSSFEALVLKRSFVWTRYGSRWTLSAAQLADCKTRESEEAPRPFELLKRAQKGHDVLITCMQR